MARVTGTAIFVKTHQRNGLEISESSYKKLSIGKITNNPSVRKVQRSLWSILQSVKNMTTVL